MNEVNKKEFNEYLTQFKEKVSKMGLKNTLQKDYIIKVLFLSEKHLTVEEITEIIRRDFNINIGIATVYRTMKFLEEMDVVESLDIGDSLKRYELNRLIHHDHLVCTSCGKIVEFTDELIEFKQVKIAEKNKFTLTNHTMTIYGLCENCQGT